MTQASRRAALAAVFISFLLLFPQVRGVHLVSNQPTGTDNQNNAPVQYAPKMASKLGLPQPQNRTPEYLTDESLANAIRQLVESHKREATFLARLASLVPRYKPEESQPKKKTSKSPAKSKSPTKNSNSSAIMRPSKKTPEIVHPPEQAKTTEFDVNSNKTEESPPAVENTACLNSRLSHSKSTIYHRNYVRPVNNVVHVPPDSRMPTHVTGDPHNAHSSKAPHVENPRALRNQYSNKAAVTSSSQNAFTLQNPHPNVFTVVPHILNPHSNVPRVAPHIQNTIGLQNPHSNVPNEAPHIHNTNGLQNPHSNAASEASHIRNTNGLQNPYNNVPGEAPHIQHYLSSQNPHSSKVHVPFYASTNPLPTDGMANQRPNESRNHHPSVVGLAPQSQDPRLRHVLKPNYISGVPLSHNPSFLHGLHPHPIDETPQTQTSIPFPGHSSFKSRYPRTLYTGNSHPGHVGQPVPHNSNGPFILNPHQLDGNAQQYNYLF